MGKRLSAVVGLALLFLPAVALAQDSTPVSGGAMATPGAGGMLGGGATTRPLAAARVEGLPAGQLAWVAYEATRPDDATPLSHRHAPGFVYAAGAPHAVAGGGLQTILQPGQGVFVGQDVEHVHGPGGPFWEVLLTAPDAGPPQGLEDARRIFASPPLEGVPPAPVQVRMVLVELPPGAQTSVHTHPGPEFIYVTQGGIDYQNAVIGTERTEVGGSHALQPDTPVQKRNTGTTPAAFLSWFVVDPTQPFAPEASFAMAATPTP